MQSIFQQFMQTWQDPHARHAMLVHFPIVLIALGVLPVLALVVGEAAGKRCTVMRVVALSCAVLASIGAGLAAGAGEEAETGVHARVPDMTEAEHEALEKHEELGEGAWKWPLITAVLVFAGFFVPEKKRAVSVVVGVLALGASIGVAVWCANTAHAGGVLVYRYGLGVPARGAVMQATPGDGAATGAGGEDWHADGFEGEHAE